jgi:8-oxo-dGTP pyrophosphatase MutT (NUDIX family)
LIDPRIRDLHAALETRRPRLAEHDPDTPRASVSLILQPSPEDVEILLIRRPTSERDPWSGHMALPGGRSHPGEAALDTAIRETLEEVGIDLLENGMMIGRLDDLHPSTSGPGIAVAPFVFAVPGAIPVNPDPGEVAATLWIPLRHLADPAAAADHLHILPDGARLRFPALAYRDHVIWGLTYRMLIQFLGIVRQARTDDAP